MKSIELKMKNENREVILTANPQTEKEMFMLISSAFSFMNENVPDNLITANYLKVEQLYSSFAKEFDMRDITEENEKFEAKIQRDEDLKVIVNQHKDGIKMKSGRKYYRTKYKCSCNHRGTHYIPSVTSRIRCHKCGFQMIVSYTNKKSTVTNILPDENFVYFESLKN